MNGLNNSSDDVVECPLCMEPLEVDDLNFFPCTCGYQICRFCWHRIRTDENELCPACRKEYPENPADFTPLTQEEMIALKSQKRQRDQQRKQKITENRKHLANVRVVQKNLVFVVGLSPRLADADILKKHEYFGKYGKIHKVVINPSTAYAGVQGPSASAYVTYVNNSDALRAIQSVNNITFDGRVIKTSLGTTKYCSYFMKNQQCPKNDCMYLHELGDSEASFTKEEMHQGKHQEYEKRLHDALIASSSTSVGTEKPPLNGNSGTLNGNGAIPSLNGGKSNDNRSNSSLSISNSNSLTLPNDSTETSTSVSSSNASSSGKTATQNKDAWPSLFANSSNKEGSEQKVNKKKEKKNEKIKNEKSKLKNAKGNNNSNVNSNSVSTTKAIRQQQNPKELSSDNTADNTNSGLERDASSERNDNNNGKSKSEKREKEKKRDNSINKFAMSADEEIKLIDKLESSNNTKDTDRGDKFYDKDGVQVEKQRSLSSNSNASTNSDSLSLLSDSGSGKSSPDSPVSQDALTTAPDEKLSNNTETASDFIIPSHIEASKKIIQAPETVHVKTATETMTMLSDNLQESKAASSIENHKIMDVNASLSKLNLFDDSNSFFSATTSLQQQFFKNKNQLGNSSGSQLPDLLSGIDGNLNSMSNEWDEAFKNVVINKKHLEEQLQHRHLHQLHNQEELFRMQEYQKRGNHYSSFGLPMNGPDNDFLSGNMNTNNDFSRLSQNAMFQQQFLQQQNALDNPFSSSLFGTNMSKFFDFHKNQQQLNQQNKTHVQQGQQVTQPQNTEQQQHSRLQNQYTPSTLVDDELGFDPFIETQKALAELMENEVAQQNMNNSSNSNNSNTIASKLLHQQQHHLIDSRQRARMPPPGFNHMNAFGVGVPRPQNNSKMLPYMNTAGSTVNHNIPMPQQQMPMSNSWNTHLNPRHSSLGDSLAYPFNQNHKNGIINKGYTNNDWTAMDPAILSLRQFPAFPAQSQMPHNPQQEMYLQQMNQQQNNHGFNPQPHHGGMNNSLLNNQPSAQAQVNANVQGMLEYLKTRQFV